MSGYSRILRARVWLVFGLMLVLLGSVLGSPLTITEAKPSADVREFSVTFENPDRISPNVFTVDVGDTIRFNMKNNTNSPHDFHIGGNGVDVQSEHVEKGQSGVWEYTFEQPGVYALYCTIEGRVPGVTAPHRATGPMEGVIVVTEPGATADLERYQARTVELGTVDNSGVTGTAYLQPRADGGTSVRIEADGLTVGRSYFAELHDRSGNILGSAQAPEAYLSRFVNVTGGTARILTSVGSEVTIDGVASVTIQEGSNPPGIVRASGASILPSPGSLAGQGTVRASESGIRLVTESLPSAEALPFSGDAAFSSLNPGMFFSLGGLALAFGALMRMMRLGSPSAATGSGNGISISPGGQSGASLSPAGLAVSLVGVALVVGVLARRKSKSP
ncbi:MAG: Copper binding protein, plastocyanin/azurin family [Dehalococcoidia bacterium]|nr:Copper binding protein, plastocyanin/azurin family [Dehalococcoidia bacterium]